MDKDLLCAETGKIIHTHENKALAHLKHLYELKDGYNGNVYRCIYCTGWHVGRTQKNAKRNKFKEKCMAKAIL